MASFRQPITVENLEIGGFAETINDHIGRACADIVSRPHVRKPRVIVATITITPDVHPETGVNLPEIQTEVGVRLPKRKGQPLRAYVEGDRVMVNITDPAGRDPHQETLLEHMDAPADGAE